MERLIRAVALLFASWLPCVQLALLYRGSEESDWYSALTGATINSVVYPASDVGSDVTTFDQHQDQGIHWSKVGGVGTSTSTWTQGYDHADFPYIHSITSQAGSWHQVYRMDFVDPSTGAARGVKAVTITIMDLNRYAANSCFVQIRDSSNQKMTMTTTGGVSSTSPHGEGFFGIIAEDGEEIYSILSGPSASHQSRGSEVKYSVLGATTTTSAPATPPRAVGDPHLTNTLGQSFDVMRAGTHALLHLPRGAAPRKTLLRIEAAMMAIEGKRCGALFIQKLRLSGSWAATKNVSTFEAGPWPGARPGGRKLVRMPLGPLFLLVNFRQAWAGFYYLDVLIPSLGKAGVPIGGLLGEDDHAWASTDPSCSHRPGDRSVRHRTALRGRDGPLGVALELPVWDAESVEAEAARGSCMRATLADVDLEC